MTALKSELQALDTDRLAEQTKKKALRKELQSTKLELKQLKEEACEMEVLKTQVRQLKADACETEREMDQMVSAEEDHLQLLQRLTAELALREEQIELLKLDLAALLSCEEEKVSYQQRAVKAKSQLVGSNKEVTVLTKRLQEQVAANQEWKELVVKQKPNTRRGSFYSVCSPPDTPRQPDSALVSPREKAESAMAISVHVAGGLTKEQLEKCNAILAAESLAGFKYISVDAEQQAAGLTEEHSRRVSPPATCTETSDLTSSNNDPIKAEFIQEFTQSFTSVGLSLVPAIPTAIQQPVRRRCNKQAAVPKANIDAQVGAQKMAASEAWKAKAKADLDKEQPANLVMHTSSTTPEQQPQDPMIDLKQEIANFGASPWPSQSPHARPASLDISASHASPAAHSDQTVAVWKRLEEQKRQQEAADANGSPAAASPAALPSNTSPATAESSGESCTQLGHCVCNLGALCPIFVAKTTSSSPAKSNLGWSSSSNRIPIQATPTKIAIVDLDVVGSCEVGELPWEPKRQSSSHAAQVRKVFVRLITQGIDPQQAAAESLWIVNGEVGDSDGSF